MVDPYHRVPHRDLELLRPELEATDLDLMPARRHGRPIRPHPEARHENDDEGANDHAWESDASPLRGHCTPASEARSIRACSRCATIAGRTPVSSAFSSAFDAPGIRTVSKASSTAW